MSNISPLTLDLIEQRPLTAVEVLAGMDASDAAEFLEALPIGHAVAVLSTTSVWSASTLISEMSPASGAALLTEFDYQTTASIMRVIPDAHRDQLLSALPKRLGRNLASTLTYPADTVGAKMSTNIVVMRADQTVGEAFAELRRTKRTKTGVAFVVDEARRFLGAVNADELLHRSNEVKLNEAIDGSVAPISARARLSTIQSLPGWDDYAYLPVVNRQRVLVGALARRSIRQPGVDSTVVPTPTSMIMTAIAGAFFYSSIGLAQILIGSKTTSGGVANEPPPSSLGGNS